MGVVVGCGVYRMMWLWVHFCVDGQTMERCLRQDPFGVKIQNSCWKHRLKIPQKSRPSAKVQKKAEDE